MTEVADRDGASPDAFVGTSGITALPRGTVVDRYVLLDVIGRGGMGIVYAAYDSQLDRKLAIKFLHGGAGEGTSYDEARARLLREAQAMARLTHPNVVAIHDVGTHGGQVFLVMELIEGDTLGHWLRTPRSWQACVEVLRAAGRGLAAAHAAGLIHRDFKPDNLLIGRALGSDPGRDLGRVGAPELRVTVTDFGVARDARDATRPTSTRSPIAPRAPAHLAGVATAQAHARGPLTLTGSLLGTIGYMSPEQAWEEPLDARTDQFSLCATLYFALYGERPFKGDDVASYLDAMAAPVAEPVDARGVPRWVHQVVVKGLSVRPDDRFVSMDALVDALGPDPSRAPRRRMETIALSIALVVSLVVVIGVAARAHRNRLYAVCEANRDELTGVWDDRTRMAIREAFVATGVVGAEETAHRVAARLDDHTAAWLAMRTDTCVGSRITHAQSTEISGRRTACLDRERAEIRTLTTVFAHADALVVQRALEATYGLALPRSCADDAALASADDAVESPAVRADVADARAKLDDAEVLRIAGKSKDALAGALAALDAGRAIPSPPLEAEALLAIGANHESAGSYADAVSPYKEAVWGGLRSKTDAVVARASARLAFILGDKLSRPDEAEDWWQLSSASLARLGPNESVETDVFAARAILLVAEGRPEESLPLHARVIALRTKNLGIDHPLTATALNNLGYSYQILGDFERAKVEHVRTFDIDLRTLGPEHPRLSIDECNLGSTAIGLGDYDDAELHLARALAIAEKTDGDNFWAAWALRYESLAATLRGDPARGLSLGERGLAILDKLGGLQLRTTPGLFVIIARAQAALGHPQAALDLCEKALQLQERSGPLRADRVYEWDALRCIGEARTSLGHAPAAIAPLERSIALPRRVYAGDLARAQVALAHALVEGGGDAGRAMSLAKEARDALARLPSARHEVDAIDAWVAAHPAAP